MKILSVVGARPNFMKLAPVDRALRARNGIEHIIVHTGQHYDRSMSDTFFRDLDIPEPHFNLEVGSASHAQQTAAIMQQFEPLCLDDPRPDLILVYGDVNSTVAAALVAAKLGIEVGHVEAGLRSRDWTMPEEINRVVTDQLSHFLFTPSRDADENLKAEGIPEARIHFVGNVMIDSLVHVLPRVRESAALSEFEVEPEQYAVVTLHRPSNVDVPAILKSLMAGLEDIAADHTVLFPVHPRTRKRIAESSITLRRHSGLRLLDPIGYLTMLSLVSRSGLVLTDSGGLQEETSFLGIPCVTVRPNTERPVTITQGTNRLVASERRALVDAARACWTNRSPKPGQIELWDGGAATRIADIVSNAS